MAKNEKQRMQDLIEEYKKAIEKELGTSSYSPKVTSKEYQEFRQEFMPKHVTVYEQLCNYSEKILKIRVGEKKGKLITENINIGHLKITPSGVISLSFLAPIIIILFG